MDRLPSNHCRRQSNSSKHQAYVASLVISKILLALSYFLTYDLLNYLHVVQFLLITKGISSLILIFVQKPFSSGKKLNSQQWLRVIRHAFLSSVLTLLSLFGLSLCGPLRTVLLTQHKDLVVIIGIRALFTNAGGHSKFRGAICLIVAVLSLLLLDFDDTQAEPTDHPEGHQHHGLSHIFYYLISWFGVADHKGGVFLLIGVLCLQTGFKTLSRTLSVDVGGAKRLNAFSSLVSTILLAPAALILPFFTNEPVVPWMSFFFPLLMCALCMHVLDYYIESICTSRLEAPLTAKLGSLSVFAASLVLGWTWGTGFSFWGDRSPIQTEHSLSGGVIFSFLMFCLGTIVLSAPDAKGSTGTFVGYSSEGDPLYHFSNDAVQKSPYSALLIIRSGLRQVLKESDSRRIFYFLCLNLAFTMIELVYGMWTNSLGLISDGFHMLFDCSALVMGLAASLLARRKASRTFPYGYGRVEVLSGFVNGLFLVVVAFMVFTEALTRMFDPPQIITERLLTVSIGGLFVNLVGIFVFRHAHSHGHGPSHNHSHQHGHGHAHSHGHSHGSNANIQGVFLHVLADTLGSVGVILSSFIIDQFGLYIADPLCSLFISVLIFISVLPLLRDSSVVLLLKTPSELEAQISLALTKVLNIEGVVSYGSQHFWRHTSDVLAGTIHIQVERDASSHKVVNQVSSLFKELGFVHFTVQVEKEDYYNHMSGLRNQTGVTVAVQGNSLHKSNGEQKHTTVKSV